MNSFFSYIINFLRGIKASVTTGFNRKRVYPIGSIISGAYSNWHHDPTPTILYLGTYIAKNGKSYIHGIQLHYLSDYDRTWLLNLIYMMKRGGQQIVPRQFYYYIKLNRPYIIKTSYRIYHQGLASFYTISPGFSNLDVKSCYTVKDSRDFAITQLNQKIDAAYNVNVGDYSNPSRVAYDKDELQNHINMILNTRKIWP